MTYSYTDTDSFTIAHARKLAGKVSADMNQCRLFYGQPSEIGIAQYQDELLREAVAKYGSEAEASRWVATPDTSPHVSGNAVDIGRSDATAWLSEHGARYGLCQIYRNEPWHYELRPEAIEWGCPAMYADPTHDPRMQR